MLVARRSSPTSSPACRSPPPTLKPPPRRKRRKNPRSFQGFARCGGRCASAEGGAQWLASVGAPTPRATQRAPCGAQREELGRRYRRGEGRDWGGREQRGGGCGGCGCIGKKPPAASASGASARPACASARLPCTGCAEGAGMGLSPLCGPLAACRGARCGARGATCAAATDFVVKRFRVPLRVRLISARRTDGASSPELVFCSLFCVAYAAVCTTNALGLNQCREEENNLQFVSK